MYPTGVGQPFHMELPCSLKCDTVCHICDLVSAVIFVNSLLRECVGVLLTVMTMLMIDIYNDVSDFNDDETNSP